MSRLVIQPQGHIQDGALDYNVVADTLSFHVLAHAHIVFFTKTVDITESYTGAPGAWQRGSWAQVGTRKEIEGGIFTVLDVKDGQGHIQIQDDDYNISGIALVDLSGDQTQPVEVLQFVGQITMYGITQAITATKE